MSSSSSSSDVTYTNETHTNDSQDEKKRNQRDATTMSRLIKLHNFGREFSIAFDVFYRVDDSDYPSLFKSNVEFFRRIEVNILIDDWKEPATDVKDSTCTYVMVLLLIFIYSISLSIICNT